MSNSNTSNQPPNRPSWGNIAIGVGIVLVLFFLFPPMRYVLIMLLGLVALIWLGWDLFERFSERRQQQQYAQTLEGRIRNRLEKCEALQAENEQQLEEIEATLQDLNHRLAQKEQLSPRNKVRLEQLQQGYERELRLRKTKSRFYQECIQRLSVLLNNHLLEKEIEERRNRLEELREDQYDELEEMEQIRYQIASSGDYLQTIENLSGRMLGSENLEEAQGLELELKKMTRELGGDV